MYIHVYEYDNYYNTIHDKMMGNDTSNDVVYHQIDGKKFKLYFQLDLLNPKCISASSFDVLLVPNKICVSYTQKTQTVFNSFICF